jgi:hypothetical protein
VRIHVVLGEIAALPRDVPERWLAQTGDDFQHGALSAPGRPKYGSEMFFRKTRRNLGKEELVIGRVSQLEGDILEFEHGGQSVVD